MNVVDAHHHIWDLAVRDQPWIDETMGLIRRSFDIDQFADVARRVGTVASVVVQCVAAPEETHELLNIAAGHPLVAGVIGYVDLTAADVGEQLDVLRERAGGDRLVGVRHVVEGEAESDWLTRPDVLRGLSAVASRDLTYDLLVRADQFAAAAAAVRAVPSGRFVLDHLGKPPIAAGALEPWIDAVRPLAAEPNVVAKLSGLCTEANWASWTAADLRPFVDQALQLFGPGRLMFGSDWPVCLLATGYEEQVDTFDVLLSHLTTAERTQIFSTNAISTYRLSIEENSHAR